MNDLRHLAPPQIVPYERAAKAGLHEAVEKAKARIANGGTEAAVLEVTFRALPEGSRDLLAYSAFVDLVND